MPRRSAGKRGFSICRGPIQPCWWAAAAGPICSRRSPPRGWAVPPRRWPRRRAARCWSPPVPAPKPAAVDALEAAIGVPHFLYRWQGPVADNPFHAFLGLSEQVVVTADSVSMLAEAFATGAPSTSSTSRRAAMPCGRRRGAPRHSAAHRLEGPHAGYHAVPSPHQSHAAALLARPARRASPDGRQRAGGMARGGCRCSHSRRGPGGWAGPRCGSHPGAFWPMSGGNSFGRDS